MKHHKCILFFLCFLLPSTGFLFAQKDIEILEEKEKWYKPDCFKIQHAGNIGFMSLGLGYTWWKNKAQADFIYGFVPKHKGNATIHTFTNKHTFLIYTFNIYNKYNISPTLGFSASFEPGENSYMRIPEKYPEGYYSPNSFYACLNAGLKTNFQFKEERYFSSIDIFCEVNTLADYVYYNLKAQEDWDDDILSLAAGINVFF